MSDKRTSNWQVRPGYVFAAGAGFGGGLFVFEFLNVDEGRIYGMGFAGAGLAGGILGGKWSTATELIKKLAVQAGLKGLGALKGAATDSTPGLKDQQWSPLPCNKAFSSADLNHSSGRVTILGASVAKVGAYGCFVSASDGIISATPLFASVSVDVQPQNFDIALGAILGMWWEAFDIPKPST